MTWKLHQHHLVLMYRNQRRVSLPPEYLTKYSYLKGFTTQWNSKFSDIFSFILEQALIKSQLPTFDTEVFHMINHYGSIRTFYPKLLDFSTLNKESK